MRALTSASNIPRRAACPGSAYAESLFPEPPDSDDSKEGTLLHDLDANPDKDRGELTSEQAEVLAKAAASDEAIFKSIRYAMKIDENEPFEEGYEKELWFYRSIKKLFPGHCDRWRWWPRIKVSAIIDKKFGRIEVTPAESNLQLRCYAIMGDRIWKAERSVVAINQPRLCYEDRLTLGEYTQETIPQAREHILSIWDASHNPDGTPREDAPRVADAKEQCRYCRAKVDCDAYRAKYGWMTAQAVDGKDSFIGRLESISDDKLAGVWEAIVFAKGVESAAKAEIIKRKESGGMGMFELQDSGNTSVINDTPKAVKLLSSYGLTDAEIMACAKLTKEALAEKIKAHEGGTIAASKKKLNEILTPVLTITAKSPSLKRVQAETKTLDNGSDAELFPK